MKAKNLLSLNKINFSKDEILKHFEVSIQEDWDFEKKIDKEITFFCKGQWLADKSFQVIKKAFMDKNRNFHTPSFLKEPRYASAIFSGHKVTERRNCFHGVLDSTQTLEPSIEIIGNDGRKVHLWHEMGVSKTNNVRYFCQQNHINLKTISPEEKMLIVFNIKHL